MHGIYNVAIGGVGYSRWGRHMELCRGDTKSGAANATYIRAVVGGRQGKRCAKYREVPFHLPKSAGTMCEVRGHEDAACEGILAYMG